MSQVEIVDGACNLEMQVWVRAKPGEYLETGGASTCAIVAVVNHTRASAWMVHQPAPHMIKHDLDDMLQDAAGYWDESDKLEIVVAGCGPEATDLDRTETLKAIDRAFPGVQPTDRWGEETLLLHPIDNSWIVSNA